MLESEGWVAASAAPAETRRSRSPVAAVVDLFCGAGGLSHGFFLEGFDIQAGFDTDERCRYAFEHNNRAPFMRRDVAAMTGAEIAERFPPGMPSVLVGCAPCQPFSVYNQKNSDPQWKLLGDFSRLISEVRPAVVSMENVPRLKRFRGGTVFQNFVSALERDGYRVSPGMAFAPDYGVPQRRSRLVLRASRAGGTWRDWDGSLVTACHRAPTGQTYSSVYGRMAWDAPSPTITTQFHGFGNGRFGHPEQDRAISLREGAILQSFPPDYGFVEPAGPVHFSVLGRMVGNAVPVLLARAIARSIRRHLEEFPS